MSQQLLRRAWNFIDTIKQVYPEHWSPEEQVLLDDLMKADLDLSGVKREWVGLTDEEIQAVLDKPEPFYDTMFWFARTIERKLKEKNT
jgi:hypothetical protein